MHHWHYACRKSFHRWPHEALTGIWGLRKEKEKKTFKT